MFKINRNKLIKYFLFVSLFILAFVEIETAGIGLLKVFAIEQNKGLILFIATVVTLLLSFIFKYGNKKIDTVLVFLFMKCIIDIIPFFFRNIETKDFWYYYIMIIIAPMIYWIFKQYDGELGKIINILSMFGVLLVVQTLITAVRNGYGYSNIMYKQYLRIPLAHSNIIGVILLTIFILRVASHRKDRFAILINTIILVGLILTQSRGAWLFLIVWRIYLFLKDANEQRKYMRLVLFTGIILTGLILFMISPKIQMLLLSTTIDNMDYTAFSSGRFDIFALALLKWSSNPWLGTGIGPTSYDIGFEVISTGVHNIVLDYGVQSGIIGVVVYFVAVISGLKFSKYRNLSLEERGIFFSLLVILAYSMFEVCYNNYVGIFFFWMLMGLYNNKHNVGVKYE